MKSNPFASSRSEDHQNADAVQVDANAGLRVLTLDELQEVSGGITVNLGDFHAKADH